MRRSVAFAWALPLLMLALSLHCASPGALPYGYRLDAPGPDWRHSGTDEVLEDLQPRYPEFFSVILDPRRTQEPDIRRLRDDLEGEGTGRERFDALNAVAIAYFELNARAQGGLLGEDDAAEDQGSTYLADSFRATKLLSIPWRAYRDIEDPTLRDAILAFYEDIATGEKKHAAETAPRIQRLVDSLEKKETDPVRIERIKALSAQVRARTPQR